MAANLTGKRGLLWLATLKLLLTSRGHEMSAKEIGARLDWDRIMVYRSLYVLRNKDLVVSRLSKGPKGIGRPMLWSFNWEKYG